MNPALNSDLGRADAESDRDSEAGILMRTVIRFDHTVIEMQVPRSRSRPDAQEQYK
jgi:hypothetical protein